MKKIKSIKHNGKQLSDILSSHLLFFQGKEGGVRADLTGADLSSADLEGANLRGAHLEDALLDGAHLEGANLTEAHLERANLMHA